MHGLLGDASSALTTGSVPPSPALLASLQESILAQLPVVLRDFRNCYISWSPFLGFQLIVSRFLCNKSAIWRRLIEECVSKAFAFAAVVHFRSLGNAMNHLRNKMNKGGMYEEDFKAISRAYQSLVATTALVGVVDLVFFSIDCEEEKLSLFFESRVLISSVTVPSGAHHLC